MSSDHATNDESKAAAERMERYVQHLTDCQNRLYAYILMLLPDHAAAEDVLQETNLVLWRKAEQFVEGTSFAAWACRIAHFQVLAWMRDAKRDRLVFDAALLEQLSGEAMPMAEEFADHCILLRLCMAKLSDGEREMLRNRYDSDQAVKDIAASLGMSPGAVATNLCRIRQELLRCIKEQLDARKNQNR